MSELNIEKANSRYILRHECEMVRRSMEGQFEAVDDRFRSLEKQLDKIESRLWELVILAIAQLLGIAITLFKMVMR